MKTVLVVDDDHTTQLLMHKIVSSLGMNVVKATNHNEALSRASELVPDLILMDIRLPGGQGGGWAAAKSIRNHPELSHIPIVIFTAGTVERSNPEYAYYEGYFQKPFQVSAILACIRDLLNG